MIFFFEMEFYIYFYYKYLNDNDNWLWEIVSIYKLWFRWNNIVMMYKINLCLFFMFYNVELLFLVSVYCELVLFIIKFYMCKLYYRNIIIVCFYRK